MRLLKTLFQRKSESKPVTKRQKADRHHQEIVTTISELTDIDTLIPLLNNDQTKVTKVVIKRLAALVDNGGINNNLLIQKIDSIETLLAIASRSKNTDLMDLILAQSMDQSTLVDLCLKTNSAAVRCALASRINEPELVRKLIKPFKTKDKAAYKLLKAKLDNIKLHEEEKRSAQQAIDNVIVEISELASKIVDKYYPLSLSRLQRLWSSAKINANDDIIQQYQKMELICQEKIRKFEQEQKKKVDRNEKLAELNNHYQEIIYNLYELINQLYSLGSNDVKSIEPIENLEKEYLQSWLALSEFGKPSKQVQKNYDQAKVTIKELIAQIQNHGTLTQLTKNIHNDQGEASRLYLKSQIDLSETLPKFKASELFIQTKIKLADWYKQQSEQEDQRKQAVRALAGLVRRANNTIEQKQLRQTIGIRYAIDEKLQSIEALPTHLQQQLEELDQAIQKLSELQAAILQPKKEALIESMQKLIDIQIDPEILADRIKQLQTQWRELSYGNSDNQEDLWVQFSQLADQAYGPCREHFQKLAEIRQKNLELRQQVIQQLIDFDSNYNWSDADLKVVENIINTARKEFFNYSPIDRDKNKPITALFDEVLAPIKEKLYQEFENNKFAKEQLIEKAFKLEEISDLDSAIESAKNLQSQWKKIGRCHYRDADRLWKEFRKHCDQVFQRRQAIKGGEKKEESKKVEILKAVIREIQSIIKLSDDEVLDNRNQRQAFIEKFNHVEGLPDRLSKSIRKEFDQIIENFDQRINEALKAKNIKSWKVVFDTCEKINTILVSPAENRHDDNDSLFNQTNHWPENSLMLLKEKLALKCTQHNTDSLRVVCIEAEILSGIDSPQEDLALRSDLQLQRLKTHFNEKQDNEISAKNLVEKWILVEPVSVETYQKYFPRFYRSWLSLYQSD